MHYAVLLLGDHPALPAAEVAALQDVERPGVTHAIHPGRVAFNLSRHVASSVTQRLAWGKAWCVVPMDEAATTLPRAVRHWAAGHEDQGEHDGVDPGCTAAVRAITFGADKVSGSALEREIGAELVAAGMTIDLEDPELEVFAWAGDGHIWVGRRLGGRDLSYWDRRLERRAHFSPIGLHPRRAANLVHLARVQPGGTIYDPFCGTGGIVLEAAVLGYQAMGSDIDARMVQGTMQTLTDAADEPLEATLFQADIGDVPDLVGTVDGIVTDMPYGAASSTHDEPIRELYERTFEAFAKMLEPGAFAVVGHRDTELLDLSEAHGLAPAPIPDGVDAAQVFEEYVHKSLTRRYAVLRRT